MWKPRNVLFLLLLVVPAWAEKSEKLVQCQGWSFQLAFPFSGPRKAGLLTQEFFYPANSNADNCLCHLEVYHLQPADLKDLKNDRAAATRLAENHLGLALLAGPESSVPVMFPGGKGWHRLYQDTSLRKRRIDLLLPPTRDGSFISLGVESFEGFSQEQRQSLLDGIVTSLRPD